MSILFVKKDDKLEKCESWDYSKDNKENYLHEIVENNPE